MLMCACARHEVRCDRRLKPINGATALAGGDEHVARSLARVPNER